MRGKIIFLVALLIIFGVSTGVQAAPADPFNQGELEYVQFWVLDDPNSFGGNNDNVQFSYLDLTIPSGSFVEYSEDNSNWFTLDTGDSITVTEKLILYLRLNDGLNNYDTSGDLTFSGFDRNYYSVDAYSTLVIDWNPNANVELSLISATSDDDIGPVPIPGTVWIFGAGLIGLVGIRKKVKS